jgi:hypothetical protein
MYQHTTRWRARLLKHLLWSLFSRMSSEIWRRLSPMFKKPSFGRRSCAMRRSSQAPHQMWEIPVSSIVLYSIHACMWRVCQILCYRQPLTFFGCAVDQVLLRSLHGAQVHKNRSTAQACYRYAQVRQERISQEERCKSFKKHQDNSGEGASSSVQVGKTSMKTQVGWGIFGDSLNWIRYDQIRVTNMAYFCGIMWTETSGE